MRNAVRSTEFAHAFEVAIRVMIRDFCLRHILPACTDDRELVLRFGGREVCVGLTELKKQVALIYDGKRVAFGNRHPFISADAFERARYLGADRDVGRLHCTGGFDAPIVGIAACSKSDC